ncbi:unnamed protein product [Linum tenue]|uniref:AP2/ERF domain-containing protein n=1 Tax=Linum tenue TaxID=586396 RepID=A0AAV0ICX2_9ROSI|nr:unnamed protein product [Linum tenue]
MAASAAKKFKGVRMRTWGSWVSEIRAPNQKTRIWLGSYSTAEAAARAYDAALLCLKGPASAAPNLNFPISSSNTFTNPPMSPKSIQRIAAAAAATTAEHPNPLPLPPSDNYNHFVPSPYASSSATSFSSSSSQSPVSTPTSDQLYEDVASLPPQQQRHGDEQLIFPTFDDDSLVSFGVPPALDDFYYEGDIRLWSFAE